MSHTYSQVIHKGDSETNPLRLLKKILILTAAFGEGENVAAANVREAIERLSPYDSHVECLDLFDSCYGRFPEILQKALQGVAQPPSRRGSSFSTILSASLGLDEHGEGLVRLRHALRDTLRSVEPDVVLVTTPIYNFLIGDIHRDPESRDFTLVSLVTEAITPESPWSRAPGDFLAVINQSAAQTLLEGGVPVDKIKVLGFPVQISGGDKKITRGDLNRGERPRLLVLPTSAWKKAPKLLDRLLEHPGWDITVAVNADTGLEEMAREKALTASDRMEVIGHTRRLPQMLRAHHLVITRPDSSLVQEAIAARCPLIVPRLDSPAEEENMTLLRQANASVFAGKPREIIDWIERALRDEARLLQLWQKNLEPLGSPDGARQLARFLLAEAETTTVPNLVALPLAADKIVASGNRRLRQLPKKVLLCDLHTHTTWSDGKLTVAEMVDFYGQRGFDCLCITDHLCDPKRLLGKLVNLTGLVIPPGEIEAYFADIQKQKKRAWDKYEMLLMTGIEFNKDGYTPKTSTHLLGVDLQHPIDPSLDIKSLIAQIQAQGGLAIASHPHEIKSEWGKNTLYLWEHVDEYAPLLDAWEVANRNDIFNPVGLKKLPFIANSDFHKPKHIHSWKTVLYCEKEAEAIKHCIRVNRDVSLTLYRDHRFALEDRHPATEPTPQLVDFPPAPLAEKQG